MPENSIFLRIFGRYASERVSSSAFDEREPERLLFGHAIPSVGVQAGGSIFACGQILQRS